MKIAATLAGAMLGALMLLPAAAQAETNLPKPQMLQQRDVAGTGQAAIAGAPDLIRKEGSSAQLTLKKRKKPQFQTRFFAE